MTLNETYAQFVTTEFRRGNTVQNYSSTNPVYPMQGGLPSISATQDYDAPPRYEDLMGMNAPWVK